MYSKVSFTILSLLVCSAVVRAEVHVEETPGEYLVRASGPRGYTAVIERTDGRLITLSAAGDEWKGGSDGAMSVMSGNKPVIARGVTANVSTPREEGASVSFSVVAGDGTTLLYRFEPERLGVRLTKGEGDLVVRPGKPEIVYTLPQRPVFGHLESYMGQAERLEIHASGGRATWMVVPVSGTMTLNTQARFVLGEKPLWLAPRQAKPTDELPFLRLVALQPRDGEQVIPPWIQQPQEYALVDSLSVEAGANFTAKMPLFANGTNMIPKRISAPRVALFLLDITKGDPQLLKEARSKGAGSSAQYAEIAPINWKKIPATLDKGILSAPTTGVAPGIYRVRLALGDGGKKVFGPDWGDTFTEPSPNAGLWGECYVVIGLPGNSLDLDTPVNREVFFRGEEIPLRLTFRSANTWAAGKATVAVGRGAQTLSTQSVAVAEIKGASRRSVVQFNTAALAPGEYSVRASFGGHSVARKIEIVEPPATSSIAVSESQLPGSPFGGTLMSSPFGGQAVDSLVHGIAAPYADLQITTFRNQLEQGTSSAFNKRLSQTLEALNQGPSGDRVAIYDLRQKWMDGMTRLGIGYWQGMQNRYLSFQKANTLPSIEGGVRMKLLSTSREYWPYANFFGPQVDVDNGGIEGNSLYPLGTPNQFTVPFRAPIAAAQKAEFEKVYAKEIAANAGKAPEGLWNDYLRSIWWRVDERDLAALRLLDPTLSLGANREYHHNNPHVGQYAPDLYRALDVHHMEVWGDALDTAMMADSWTSFAVAARRAIQRPEQPIWMETQAYHGAVPDYMQTRWWGVLANGGDGVGYAANVFGLRGFTAIEPHMPNWRRQTAVAMTKLARTIGPALQASEKDARVAILFSKTEADKTGSAGSTYNVHAFKTNPPFVSFFGLAMAGYSPDYIFEEGILNGDLKRYKAIYLTLQRHAMKPAIQAKIDEWVAAGGKLIVDESSDAKLFPKALKVAVNTNNYKGPHAFGGPEDWAWMDANVPTLKAALDGVLAPLGRAEHPRCVTYWLSRGATKYCIVANEGYAPIQVPLKLSVPMEGYEILSGARIEKSAEINVDLRSVSVRVFAFTPGPIGKLAVRATPKLQAGNAFAISAGVLGTDGKALDVLAPAIYRVADAADKTVWERWTPVGKGLAPATWKTATTQAAGTYTASVTELLSGQTASFTVQISAGKAPTGLLRDGSTPVAIAERDARTLARLWNARGTRWAIVMEAGQKQRAGKIKAFAESLKARGLTISLWQSPPTISMPVGYVFTPDQQAARDKVEVGEAIGNRVYIHGSGGDNKAPHSQMWEQKSGTAINRNVIVIGQPGESHLLDRFGPHSRNEENSAAISVGMRLFSGYHDAVFISGQTEADLTLAMNYALSLKDGEKLVGPEAGRRAFSIASGLPVKGASTPVTPPLLSVAAKNSQTKILWREQLGRPVMAIKVSPNGKHILVKHHGASQMSGVYSPSGEVEGVVARSNVGDTGDSDVRDVTDKGEILLVNAKGRSLLALDGKQSEPQPNLLWQSANGDETMRFEKFDVEVKDGADKTKTVAKSQLVRKRGAQMLWESPEAGAIGGNLEVSPGGKYLLDNGNMPSAGRMISKSRIQMFDGQSGKLMWQKNGWWLYNTSWSRDGEFFAVVRHFPHSDRHGIWNIEYGRATISLVRAKDGEVVSQGHPMTRPNRIMVAGDNSFAVAVPAYMADHFWLLRPEQEMQKVTASKAWLYDVALAGDGQELFTLDMNGVLRRQKPTGETVWTSTALERPNTPISGPTLGILAPLGDDVLLGTPAGQVIRLGGGDGKIAWQRTTAGVFGSAAPGAAK